MLRHEPRRSRPLSPASRRNAPQRGSPQGLAAALPRAEQPPRWQRRQTLQSAHRTSPGHRWLFANFLACSHNPCFSLAFQRLCAPSLQPFGAAVQTRMKARWIRAPISACLSAVAMAQSRSGPSWAERASRDPLAPGPRSLQSRIGRREPRKGEQVHEARVEVERAAANAIGVDAILLAEADGGEAFGRRAEGGAQELRLL
jgi:hypothetical protein